MTKGEIINYLKNNELDNAIAGVSLVALDMAFKSYTESDSLHGVLYSPGFAFFSFDKMGSFHQFNAKKIIEDIAKKVYDDYLRDPKSADKMIERQIFLEKEIEKAWEEYFKNGATYSKEKIFDFYKKFSILSGEWFHYCSLWEDKGAIINKEIVPHFAKRHNLEINKADEIFNTLAHPEEPTVFNLEREDFLRICIEVSSGKILKENIKSYIDKYFWFRSDFYKAEETTPEKILKEVYVEISKNKKEGIELEIEKNRQNFDVLHENRKKILGTIELTEIDKRDLAFAKLVIQWIDLRKIGMMRFFYYLAMTMDHTAKVSNIPYEDLAVYTFDEFGKCLESEYKLNVEEIRRRKAGVFMVWEKGQNAKIFYDGEAKELFSVATAFKFEGFVKGQVASRGGVSNFSGKVRVVLDPSKDIFEDGEILVTSMTRIEFVPLMRKAKAIITNEGGIACHAAIISRELGIPCIIGTKIATKVLKDGDLVEVNVNEGVVKIIKRYEED